MGRRALLLLLLAFLAPGAAITLRPTLRTLGSLHLPTSSTSRYAVARNYSVHYFQQKIDHFGFTIMKTFKQRYIIADKYWKKDGGSILFYTGNEGDIIWFCNNTGFMWDVAKELKAMLVFAEHRYYGESLPFGHSSYKDSRHLNFLTSEQALADFAELIKHLKRTIPGAENQPVIALGGSYGGMLAAWFRMKYPHIVVGALAASAPILQFDNLIPCGVFMKIVTTDFRKSGPYCSESIRRSWDAINRLSNTGRGLRWLTEALHLCNPLDSQDIQHLKDWIAETWVNLAMVDYPYASNFLQPLPAWPIKVACQYLRNPNVSDSVLLENIFQALNVYYNYSGQAQCLNMSETTTRSLGSQGWSYQACTEMVMPFCTNGIDDMFEPRLWDLKEFSDDCFNHWGVRPRPSWISTLYGGKNISSHTNIVFSNGELDPWSGGGITEDITDTLVAITISEGAHHLDLRASNPLDPSSVLLARTLEVGHMKKWIKDFYGRAGKEELRDF
uniref:Lysosomal Pro-X carboxypeptidase n=1 Tax=Microcebus murinus TaxID=30608 RepID=A0A8B7EBK0_MICMU|nr:lysosomal Pro-X carboxypeptidase isoform X1 [Microcebus murinus]XP_012591566.1 lysosomal Pro-X carboxypeptidase isoform X1 [Microcebus murinus]XP_012591567.1 lysosomal Pro-X carboxypeptidase isoform X1 [Microcebus murinus]XP_012591568.1 lysosomal Pro-X carboxypeptidase isoform X1 [Microcebus murinus]XP_012591569.1 lysosomal Pro-X carboxypeptidase isoform X1 [Microcebus murinus]XP_012591570.1 lysosomal Pro-X carboxypeptidase isoform X1 [Microcebus murinus]XP_020142226.1 lysosomal Pro-X carb